MTAPSRAPGGEAVLALEFVEVEYEMRIALSSAQDSETIRAHLKNGVLSVLLPRRRAHGPHTVPINVEED